ncbi:hypothetical protein HN011_000668 [Eciton burchellii]|nr:hypothetical protein HN011_000665 [Eciton burchellii]KAH0945849.1 hypothetical protein HN011_000668 [Eciton burchellii]
MCERAILDGCPTFSAKCQTEKRSLPGISLLYEFELKTLNERFLWNVWKQAENGNKTGLQENRTSMIMGRETGTLESECVTNTQSDTIIHNKTQTDIYEQEEQFNNGVPKKPTTNPGSKLIPEEDRFLWTNRL